MRRSLLQAFAKQGQSLSLSPERTFPALSGLPHNLGTFIVRIGLGGHYTIVIIRNPKIVLVIISAPIVGLQEDLRLQIHKGLKRIYGSEAKGMGKLYGFRMFLGGYGV